MEKRQLIGTTTIIIVLFTILLLGGSAMPLIRLMDIEDAKARRRNKKDINLSKTEKMVSARWARAGQRVGPHFLPGNGKGDQVEDAQYPRTGGCPHALKCGSEVSCLPASWPSDANGGRGVGAQTCTRLSQQRSSPARSIPAPRAQDRKVSRSHHFLNVDVGASGHGEVPPTEDKWGHGLGLEGPGAQLQ